MAAGAVRAALRGTARGGSRLRAALRSGLEGLYQRRLAAAVQSQRPPRHVGVILDGNRRWARASGFDSRSGHQAGADKVLELTEWCEQAGVEVVTLWMLSTDNLERPAAELEPLLGIIEDLVERLARDGRWRVHPVGALDLLPESTRRALEAASSATAGCSGLHVNVAVGYGGRREIADAVRSLLAEHAANGATLEEVVEVFDVEHIAEHLYTAGQPDPDLVIRTSGEQRLSGFMLWQSVHSEFYFCEAYWPDFRRVDFLRAVRAYAERNRRLGR